MNEVLNNIYTRRSIRKFTDQAVPKDLVDEVVKAGAHAPSGKNMQTYRFFIMQKEESILALQEVVAKGMENPSYTFYGTKALVIVTCNKEDVNGVEDGSCALENMMLAAHSLGLGSCWIHREREMFASDEGKELLSRWGITKPLVGVGGLALGYPDGDLPQPKPRKEGYVVKIL